MTLPFVSVEWWDAWADAHDSVEENAADARHKATRMETRGWLVRDTEAGVSLFNERCLDKGDECFRSRTFIPRVLVVSVTPLKETKPRKVKVPRASVTPIHPAV